MRNASAQVWQPTSALTFVRRNPTGDFTATYVNTPQGRKSGRLASIDQIPTITAGRLSDMRDGTFVIVYGTIESVRVFEQPTRYDFTLTRATVRLSSGTGAETIIDVRPMHYDNLWGYLVMGRSFGFSGHVVRSEQGAPEHINMARLLLAGSDLATPETYAVQQAAPALAGV
jgi:hypothetical protein